MSDRAEIANIIERSLRNGNSMHNFVHCIRLTDARLDGRFDLVAVADEIIASGFRKAVSDGDVDA